MRMTVMKMVIKLIHFSLADFTAHHTVLSGHLWATAHQLISTAVGFVQCILSEPSCPLGIIFMTEVVKVLYYCVAMKCKISFFPNKQETNLHK